MTLLKYLKKYWKSLIVIICFLAIQANVELTIPEYTSNIVNVGIQQSGIEDSCLEKMTEDTYNKLLSINVSNNDEIIKDSYILTEENNYILKDKVNRNDLNKVMEKSLLMINILTSSNQDINSFNYLSDEELTKVLLPMEEQFKVFSSSMMTQSNISFMKLEYEKVGYDLDSKQMNYILVTGAKMLGLAIVAMAMAVIVTLLAAKISGKIARDLRERVFKKVLSFSKKEINDFSTASLITRSTNDIQQIAMLIVMLIRVVIFSPIMGIGGVIKVLATDTSMTWIIILALACVVTLLIVVFIFAVPKMNLFQKLIDKINLVSREMVNGFQVIRAFSNEKHEEKRFDKSNKEITGVYLFVSRIMSLTSPIMTFVMNGTMVLILWKGATSIDLGTLQVGNMIAFMNYSVHIIMSFLMIGIVIMVFPRALVSIKRVDEVLKKDVIIDDTKEEIIPTKKGYIEFKNVDFKYPNASNYILHDISFETKPGEITAIVGSTGSGKSTLINLIMRFFDTTNGEVLVNGVNVKNQKLESLYKQIGYVPQKSLLFTGDIKSNIKYGNKELTDEELDQVLDISQAKEFVSELDQGINYEIVQDGGNISGGQRQRLAIARALAVKPDIYIFDDSFSALDYKTDHNLRKALQEEIKDKAVIIVAQRISTIMNANQIIVLDEGKIAGIGTHEELLKKCKIYKEIASSQLGEGEIKNA